MSREEYSGVLDTNRYEINSILGRGSWGTVYAAKDTALGMDVAIKVLTPSTQARDKLARRQITPFDAIAREGGLAPGAHIVPRSFEVDNCGMPFIVMPIYDRFLDQVIGDDGTRNSVAGNSLDRESVVRYLADIARGISEMHKTRGRAHADIKPDNIAVGRDGGLLLNDLGNATLTSLDWVEKTSPRDNMGAWYTRAPELFLDDSHPERASDVWSFGALAYRLVTGKYPLEDELKNVRDSKQYIASLGSEGLDAVLQKKIRSNIKDKRMRKLIVDSLLANPNERLSSGNLVSRVESATSGTFIKDAWNLTKKLGFTVGTVAALTAGGYVIATAPEPLPRDPPKVSGLLYLEDPNGKNFDIEEIFELPVPADGAFIADVDRVARRHTSIPSIAYLLSCRAKAILSGGLWGAERITDHERSLFEKHALPEEKKKLEESKHGITGVSEVYLIPAVALEATMNSIRDARGRVDLEDLLVLSRLGEEVFYPFKYANIGRNFTDYQHILPEDELKFIKNWLAYIHQDLARK